MRFSRRTALKSLAAGGSILAGCARATSARNLLSSLKEQFVQLQSRMDGRPVVWFLTGTEYVTKDRRMVPLSQRTMLTAMRAIWTGEQTLSIPYVETIITEQAPAQGEPFSNISTLAPLRGQFDYDEENALTQTVRLPNGTSARYAGYLSKSRLYPGGINQNYDIMIDYADGTKAEINELIDVYPTTDGAPEPGFRDARIRASIVRPALRGGVWGMPNAITVSRYSGKKYSSLEPIAGLLTPDQTAAFTPFFEQWEGLLYE